ncbi:DNA polymerase III subunit gamma/tau [Patescibacteria group bacterium]|nr:DNA polymerase III subunit gamma/tau [Patescibacteria group bacterium]
MVTLYRKYRPTNFKQVFSQNHIKITLENQIKTNSIGHAYLFCGPRAVGKTTLARILAKSINCEKRETGDSEPCNECQNCKEIAKNAGLDIFEIDAASHTGVDNVRENIINAARVAPTKYKYKVFIIDEVHMLSISAFNALLKIMEEPPSYILFILATTETHKIPQTIISRCQKFNFKKNGINDITTKLESIANSENIKIEKSILESIARHSGGHMRDAESLLAQVFSVGGDTVTREEADLVIPRSNTDEAIRLIELLVNKNTIEAIQLINTNLENGIDLKIFTNELIEILRKIALAKTSPILSEKLSTELGESLEKRISSIVSDSDMKMTLLMIEELTKANLEIDSYPVAQMSLELAVIKITLPRNSLEPAQITNRPVNMFTAPTNQTTTNTFNQPQTSTVAAPVTTIPPIIAVAPTEQTQIASNPTSEASVAEIKDKWKEILTSLAQSNPSVSFILRACDPTDLNNGILTLAFKYKFHKDQADKPENQQIIKQALNIFFNTSFTLITVISDNTVIAAESVTTQPIAPQAQAPIINNAATEAFLTPSNETIPIDNNVNNGNDSSTGQDNGEIMSQILETFGGKIVN